jgi:hypothetical protein
MSSIGLLYHGPFYMSSGDIFGIGCWSHLWLLAPVEIRSGPFCSAMCYYLDMRWRDIAYALAMAVVGAVALTTIMDLASALWR